VRPAEQWSACFRGLSAGGQETRLGQRFVVDATLLCDLRAAGRSDDLADTIDYAALYRCAEAVFSP